VRDVRVCIHVKMIAANTSVTVSNVTAALPALRLVPTPAHVGVHLAPSDHAASQVNSEIPSSTDEHTSIRALIILALFNIKIHSAAGTSSLIPVKLSMCCRRLFENRYRWGSIGVVRLSPITVLLKKIYSETDTFLVLHLRRTEVGRNL